MKTVLYTKVSSKEQKEFSIPAQFELLKDYTSQKERKIKIYKTSKGKIS